MCYTCIIKEKESVVMNVTIKVDEDEVYKTVHTATILETFIKEEVNIKEGDMLTFVYENEVKKYSVYVYRTKAGNIVLNFRR